MRAGVSMWRHALRSAETAPSSMFNHLNFMMNKTMAEKLQKSRTFWGEPREASECLNSVLNRKYIKFPDRRKFLDEKYYFIMEKNHFEIFQIGFLAC